MMPRKQEKGGEGAEMVPPLLVFSEQTPIAEMGRKNRPRGRDKKSPIRSLTSRRKKGKGGGGEEPVE